jgi:diguanylate cyclase (GGDEF)-like protein
MPESRPSFFAVAADYAREHLNIAKTLIIILLTLVVVSLYSAGVFDSAENAFFDASFRHRAQQYTSSKIVIIEINDAAIRSVGRWPWDREWHATLMQALKDMGARAIGMDMIFSEEANPRTDDLLAKVIEKSNLVYLPVAYNKIQAGKGIGRTGSLPIFTSAARGEGHTQIEPDPDGVLRTARLFVDDGRVRKWHMGFLLALNNWGLEPESIQILNRGIRIPIPDNPAFMIPLDRDAKFVINWPARWSESFRHVSYVDVINSYSAMLKKEKPPLSPDIFKGAVCLVGVTAAGLFDIQRTPLEAAYPTVGVTASILNSLLERSMVTPVGRRVNVVILLFLAGIILLVALRFEFTGSLIAIGALAIIYTVLAYGLFIYAHLIISFSCPLIMIISGYAALVGYHQFIIIMEKNRLMKLVTTDPLTGLFNIVHFKRLLEADLQGTQLRTKKDICLVMADGDHFKKINDTYGHAAGDDVLRGLADVLKVNCRALDVAARYGGEEFIVMLPGATLEAGLKVAEKMRTGIEKRNYDLRSGGAAIRFTASFGVVAFDPGESMDAFLKRADEALYLAKKSGRNCVCTL